MLTRLRLPDVLVPATVTALGVLELSLVHPEGWMRGIAIEVLAGALLVWRRAVPLLTCTLAAVIVLVMPWAGPQLDDVAAPILLLALVCYSLARWIADLRGTIGLAVILLAFLASYLLLDTRVHDLTDVVFVGTLAIPPYVVGRIARKLAEQNALLSRQAELIRDQAVREERDRIARELHDVIAHSVSAMVVQTAAAQDLVRADPDRAGALLASVADTGRRALAETGRLLHLVRDTTDELGLSPAPGLGDVPGLVERFREDGLVVEATLDLPRQAVPGGVDVSAYRVVQEALTNALKHGAGPVRLSVDAAGEQVRITCSNPVGQRRTEVTGSGLGLQGMAERVEMLGGTLRHGESGGRFEVDLVIRLAP